MSDDLIRRSDAIGAIANHCENECYYRVDSWCPQCQREEFQEAIKTVPSADRPQGYWTNRHKWDNGFVERECSLCGAMKPILMHTAKINYCPNCGAKMVREANK